MFQELRSKSTLVFGCGNTLMGDDGFGPAVIDHLIQNYPLPDRVLAEDVGTGIRDLLFDLLLDPPPSCRILIIDAAHREGLAVGQLAEIELGQVEPAKSNDFAVHQFPSLNILEELSRLEGIEVKILTVRAGEMPGEVRQGLSPEVRDAVPPACDWIMEHVAPERE